MSTKTHREDCRCPNCDPEAAAVLNMDSEQLAAFLSLQQNHLVKNLASRSRTLRGTPKLTTSKGGEPCSCGGTSKEDQATTRHAELSDIDRRRLLFDLLYQVKPALIEIVEVYPEAGVVVYICNPEGDYAFFKRSFTVTGDTIKIEDDEVEVEPATSYTEKPTAAARAAARYLASMPRDPYKINGILAAAAARQSSLSNVRSNAPRDPYGLFTNQ